MNDELDLLISRYLDGTASEEEIRRLDEMVRREPEVCRELFLAAHQDVALQDLLSVESYKKDALSSGIDKDSLTVKKHMASKYGRISSSRSGLWRWIVPAAAAAVLVVVLVLVFFPGSSGTTDVAEEETFFPEQAEKKPTIEKKDTTPAPVREKRVVEKVPAPPKKKGPELAKVPAPPVEKESPAPEQPKKKPPLADKPGEPEEPEKPVAPVREEPKTKLVEKEQQTPAPVFLAITIDDELKSKGKLQVRKGKRWQTVGAADITEDGTFLWQADEQIRATRLARFSTEDGTQVLLSRATLSLGGVKPVTLVLERGEIFCEVAKPKRKDEKGETLKTGSEGKTIFMVRTKEAEVCVTGTKFGVKRAAGRTMVMVTEGEVVLANTKGEVKVPAGTSSSAVKTSAPKKPKPVKAGKYFGWRYQLASPVVWKHDFDKIDGEKEKIGGKLVLLNEPSGKVSALESKRQPEKFKGPNWKPDEKMSLFNPKQKKGEPAYLFAIPENCEIRVRIKSEKSGTFQLSIYYFKQLDKPEGNDSSFEVTDLPVGPDWKEIVLRGKDFKPRKSSQSFQRGLYIYLVDLWGFGTGKIYLDRITVTGKSRK